MNYVESIEDKIRVIRDHFSELIGFSISSYELAQMWCEEEKEWDDWMDIPLFLNIDQRTLSISWYKFDELAIQFGRELPFSLGGSTVRWLSEGVHALDTVIGQEITSVSLGRGEMTVGDSDIEIWTRLLISLGNGSTLDIFNALDENGIDVFSGEIQGDIINCI